MIPFGRRAHILVLLSGHRERHLDDDAKPEANESLKRELVDLKASLEAIQSQQANHGQRADRGLEATTGAQLKPPAGEQTYFGLTFGALFLGLIISTVGLGYIRYAKVTSQLSFFLVGAALIGIAFFVKDAWLLLSASVLIVCLSIVVRRFVRF
jgi:hypothetical protein